MSTNGLPGNREEDIRAGTTQTISVEIRTEMMERAYAAPITFGMA